MSKEPEAKDVAEAPRKRRGGLRVPSDNVPRRPGSDAEVAAPVPEAVGLAASVSESFGVAGGAEEDVASNGGNPARATSEVRLETEDEVTQVAPEAPQAARSDSDEGEDVDFTEDETSIDMEPRGESEPDNRELMNPAVNPVVRGKRADSTSPGIIPPARAAEPAPAAEGEVGESVDIPFDDETMTTSIPEPPAEAEAKPPAPKAAAPAPPAPAPKAAKAPAPKAPAPAAPKAVVESEKTVKTEAPAAVATAAAAKPKAAAKKPRAITEESTAAKKKPRFTRALTMALNESDLEEVRGRTNNDAAAAASPVEEASPLDSSDVIAEDDMEEISDKKPPSPPKEAAERPKKRAETAEPPPPPPPAKAAPPAQKSTPPAPKAAAPKAAPPSAEDAKRRQRKPWFEELFDEDYLRTLPFLTPQATQFEANFVMESLGVDAGAQILDVGCGYGRHAMELAARGYHLVGLDSSLPLLLRGADEAQRRGLTINFVHGDMRDMTFESQFDGAYCLFSSFGYFDDETNKRTAQNIARALKPGARFVVEVLNRDYLVADLPSRVWWEGDGCVVLEEVEFNYFSSRIVSNRSVVFDDGRQLEHEISLRSFSLHELGKFLHAVGFRVLEISGSMSTRGRFFGAHSRDIVVVAERRATKADEA